MEDYGGREIYINYLLMKKTETIKTLELLNRWRLGEEIEQPEPKVITEAINSAIQYLKEPNL